MSAPSTLDPRASFQELSAELERALLVELVTEYKRINRDVFGDALDMPSLKLVDSSSRLGQWIHATRSLELSRRLVVEPHGRHILALNAFVLRERLPERLFVAE